MFAYGTSLTSELDGLYYIYLCAVLNLNCHIYPKTYVLFYAFFYVIILA